MKVLMFGWEFPPHISGGLGTACYGISKGLSSIEGMEILFVVPKTHGDEHPSELKLLAAENVRIGKPEDLPEKLREAMELMEVESRLIPYTDPNAERKALRFSKEVPGMLIKPDPKGRLSFSGQYGADLFREISKYSLTADYIAREHEFDIIHAHDWLTFPAGIAAKKASGKPLVIHIHATDFDRSGGSANPSVYEIEKRGMEAADRIITVSKLTRNIVIEKYGIRPEKTITVYNAVEPLEKKEFIHKKGSQEKVVTFLGRITLQKGPGYFLESAKVVLENMDNVRFVMAGSGDMMNEMIKRVAELGISDRFHFTGFLKGNEVFELLHLSDVYVMPSISEPFGISPLEAMQSNVPVILSHQSGVSEVLTHVVKVDFWDTEAMADAIHGILTYPALSGMLTKHGKTEADGLRWEDAAKNIYSIYKNIMAA